MLQIQQKRGIDAGTAQPDDAVVRLEIRMNRSPAFGLAVLGARGG